MKPQKFLFIAASIAAMNLLASANAAKANIYLLATGGTIAGTADSSTNMTGYTPGQLAVQALLKSVPSVVEVANVTGEQVANIGSESMTDDVWLKLARRINELLARRDVDGIVVTHGTDTMDETAYFLNLVVKSDKPVVMVGAMRPATAISADGPANIYNAIKLASSKDAVGKGVMIAMNDTISGAREATKTNTLRVDTFKNQELGYMGYFEDGEPVFYHQSTRRHTKNTEFDISELRELPRVDIIYSHVNDDGKMALSAVANGAKGIIHAGTGNGSLHMQTHLTLTEIAKEGKVKVVRSSRVPYGPTIKSYPGWDEVGMIQSGTLSPQKARVLLQLALTKTNDAKEIQKMFRIY